MEDLRPVIKQICETLKCKASDIPSATQRLVDQVDELKIKFAEAEKKLADRLKEIEAGKFYPDIGNLISVKTFRKILQAKIDNHRVGQLSLTMTEYAKICMINDLVSDYNPKELIEINKIKDGYADITRVSTQTIIECIKY